MIEGWAICPSFLLRVLAVPLILRPIEYFDVYMYNLRINN
jgi:hypothetical protein